MDRKRVFFFLIFDSFSFSKRIIRTLYSFLLISTLSSHCASTFSVLSEPARISPTNVTTVFVMFALCFFSPCCVVVIIESKYNINNIANLTYNKFCVTLFSADSIEHLRMKHPFLGNKDQTPKENCIMFSMLYFPHNCSSV